MATPAQVAAELLGSVARLTDHIGREIKDAGDDVRDIEREHTHEVSGDLKGSLTPSPVEEIGTALVLTIAPINIDYAEREAEHGEEHGFAAKGFAAAQPRIDTLRRALERTLVRAFEGEL